MRAILLSTIFVALGVPLASASATTIFSETFDTAAGGNYGVGQHIGQFTVYQGDADIFGHPQTAYACGAEGNGCLDLNGNSNGGIVTGPLAIALGNIYTVSFDLGGNGTPYSPSPTNPYTLDVGFGGTIHSFSVNPVAPFTRVSFDWSPTASGSTMLSLTSTSTNLPSYWGAVIDNVSVTSFDRSPSPAPEPASWAMMLIGFGITGYGVRRRARGIAASL